MIHVKLITVLPHYPPPPPPPHPHPPTTHTPRICTSCLLTVLSMQSFCCSFYTGHFGCSSQVFFSHFILFNVLLLGMDSPVWTCGHMMGKKQGPVVQSIVSLTSSLVVKMLTALVSTISKLQVFLLKKMWVAFANAKATHIFLAKILGYMPYLLIKVWTIR